MEIRDQLFRLVRIQEIAQETRAARALVDGAPARIEQIESHFRERNAEYVAVKQRFDALEEDQGLQEAVLSVFHAVAMTFLSTPCVKLVENHNGKGSFQMATPSPG